MPKINLLNRAKKKQLQKHKAAKDSVWIIGKNQNQREYFVMKVDNEGHIVTWTDNQGKALHFHTEKGCQHFVKAYLSNRTDIHLRWLEATRL